MLPSLAPTIAHISLAPLMVVDILPNIASAMVLPAAVSPPIPDVIFVVIILPTSSAFTSIPLIKAANAVAPFWLSDWISGPRLLNHFLNSAAFPVRNPDIWLGEAVFQKKPIWLIAGPNDFEN